MKVVGAPELGISAVDEKELHRLTKRAATYVEKVTFCNQPRVTLASAIEFREDLERRLAVFQKRGYPEEGATRRSFHVFIGKVVPFSSCTNCQHMPALVSVHLIGARDRHRSRLQ